MENRVKEICKELDDMFYGCFVQKAVDKEHYETAQVAKELIDDLKSLKNKK